MSIDKNAERQVQDGEDNKVLDIPAGKTAKKKKIGSGKGVETMFRNAYRAELDLIALAATKANIMISLNGFIVSALMISGGFIYAATPLFLVPSTLFLFTSALSIYFALTAASPDITPTHTKVFSWLKDVVKGKAKIRSFKSYVFPEQRFIKGQSNILLYEDRANLSKSEYLEHMHDLLSDQEQIYEKMSEQLYWLGMITSKKFKMLGASYAVFRWGIIFSVLGLLAVKSIEYFAPLSNGSSISKIKNVGVSQFEDIYEPSAVQQLLDGRLIIVEDEPTRAISLVEFNADGSLLENSLLDNFLLKSFNRKINDLEGLTMDSKGFIYAITSHSRNEKGKRKKSRELLLRFKIEGNEVTEESVYTQLTDDLLESGVLNNVLLKSSEESFNFNNINIEAFSFDKDKNKLMLGFREPLIDGKSMLVTLENPFAMFDRGEQPKFSDNIILLDLKGGGIRSLDYDPKLGGYLMVNEIKKEGEKKRSQLWFWSGKTDAEPQPIDLPKMINLKNVESIAPVSFNGESRLLLLSDDGNAKKKKAAHYMLLEYDQLSER